jgi:putative hydrolase of the HAD superfamily
MMRETILFIDLDGTIMLNPFLSAVFPALAPVDLTREYLAEQRARLAQPNADPVWVMDWDDICAVVLRRHDLPAASVTDLVLEYSRPPHIAILDEADTILRQIRTPYRRLVVASMGLSRYQLPVLRALGLADLFADFLMPDLTGALKTDARFYARYAGADALKISVGDNVVDDVLRPQSFGFRTILKAAQPPLNAVPDRVITTLAELPAAVESLESAPP